MRQFIMLIVLILSTSIISFAVEPCKGTKKDGSKCKSTMILKDGYCRSHSPSTPKCGAIKSNKEPCKMVVSKPGEKCRYHQ